MRGKVFRLSPHQSREKREDGGEERRMRGKRRSGPGGACRGEYNVVRVRFFHVSLEVILVLKHLAANATVDIHLTEVLLQAWGV